MKEPLQVVYYALDEVRRLKDYLAFSERLLEEEHRTYLDSLSEDNEQARLRFDYRRDLGADLAQTFPQYLRSSSLLVLFAIFEENLNHICKALEEHNALRLAISDLSNKGIDRGRNYMSKVAGWKVPETNDWQELKKIQTIRNIWAHRAGYISPDQSAERKIVEESQHLKIESFARDRIVLEKGYLEHCRSSIESYLSDLAKLNEPT